MIAAESGWHLFLERGKPTKLNRFVADTGWWQVPEPVAFPEKAVDMTPEVVDQHVSVVRDFFCDVKVDQRTASLFRKTCTTGADVVEEEFDDLDEMPENKQAFADGTLVLSEDVSVSSALSLIHISEPTRPY